MPTYEVLCEECGRITEYICCVDERTKVVVCSYCKGPTERIIGSNIQRLEPTWLQSAKRSLQPEARSGINDRNDLDRYLKKEGIEQIG